MIREISKTMMFAIAWAFPIVLAWLFSNSYYLWFFILSVFITCAIFNHYEEIEKWESQDDYDELL